MGYLDLKLAHVLIAVVAVGTSAALAFLHVFFAAHPVHGGFVLRMIRRMLGFVVVPGYLLMLATGMWMGHLANLLDARWAEMAMNVWGIGALFFGATWVILRKQVVAFESAGPASPVHRRLATFSRLCGLGAGLVVVVIIYFMVFKPA